MRQDPLWSAPHSGRTRQRCRGGGSAVRCSRATTRASAASVPAAATPADEGEAPGQPDAGQVEAQIARLDCGDRDVAAAVLARADDALEVVERVIVDVDGQPSHVGIEGRTFRHGQLNSTPAASRRRS